ncbi:hypothetical protein [Streptosporangium canum]
MAEARGPRPASPTEKLYNRVHGPRHPLTLAILNAGIRWTFARK